MSYMRFEALLVWLGDDVHEVRRFADTLIIDAIHAKGDVEQVILHALVRAQSFVLSPPHLETLRDRVRRQRRAHDERDPGVIIGPLEPRARHLQAQSIRRPYPCRPLEAPSLAYVLVVVPEPARLVRETPRQLEYLAVIEALPRALWCALRRVIDAS